MDDEGWGTSHLEAIRVVSEYFGDAVDVDYADALGEPAAWEAAAARFAEEGAALVVGTSTEHGATLAALAAAHPATRVLALLPDAAARAAGRGLANWAEASPPPDDAVYLAGVALADAHEGPYCFVAPVDTPLVRAAVNSLALGLRAVRADAALDVLYTGSWSAAARERAAAHWFLARGCEGLASYTDTPAPLRVFAAAHKPAVGTKADFAHFAALALAASDANATVNWATAWGASGGTSMRETTTLTSEGVKDNNENSESDSGSDSESSSGHNNDFPDYSDDSDTDIFDSEALTYILTSAVYAWTGPEIRAVRAVLGEAGAAWTASDTGGLAAGNVRLAPLSARVPAAAQVRLRALERRAGGGAALLVGPIRDNNGEERVPAGVPLAGALREHTDWYAAGVRHVWPAWAPQACAPGAYLGDDLACTPCAPGTFRAHAGLVSRCTPCAPGTHSPASGATACAPCPAGTHSADSGARECDECPAGTHSPGNATACAPCAPGTYALRPGRAECTPCERGTYQPARGAQFCASCPADATTAHAGAASAAACRCRRARTAVRDEDGALRCAVGDTVSFPYAVGSALVVFLVAANVLALVFGARYAVRTTDADEDEGEGEGDESVPPAPPYASSALSPDTPSPVPLVSEPE